MFRNAFVILIAALLAAAAPPAAKFTLASTDFYEGKTIPSKNVFNGMGCTGQNISPQLEWDGAPEGARSFAITMYDPDAPTGSGWWHWVVYNIPAGTERLPAGAGNASKSLLPAGAVQGNTDFGTARLRRTLPASG